MNGNSAVGVNARPIGVEETGAQRNIGRLNARLSEHGNNTISLAIAHRMDLSLVIFLTNLA